MKTNNPLHEFETLGYDITEFKQYENFLLECSQKDYTDQGTHRHHIVPKFMGGNNGHDNLIVLNYEDHYTAHKVLGDCFPTGHVNKGKNYISSRLILGNTIKILRKKYTDLTDETYPEFWKLAHSEIKKLISGEKSVRSGWRITPEQRKRLSESQMGHPTSQETREKIRSAKLKNPHHLTDEQRQKMIKFRVNQFDLSGNIIGTWITEQSILDAGLSIKIVRSCCRGKKYLYEGSVWRNFGDAFDKFPIMSLISDRCNFYTSLFPKVVNKSGGPIIQCNEFGKELKEWSSVVTAAKHLNFTPHYIRQCCKGNILIYNNYHWKYKNDRQND